MTEHTNQSGKEDPPPFPANDSGKRDQPPLSRRDAGDFLGRPPAKGSLSFATSFIPLLVMAMVLLLAVGGADRLRVNAGPGENCLACHGAVTGLDGPHSPARIGCASCHAGNATARDKATAHDGMFLIPGNLDDAARTCGQAGCHETIVPRVQQSIMTTMAGVIAVDRTVLGDPSASEPGIPDVRHLGHGFADRHVRELCAGCHLGQVKTEWGPVAEDSLGGGCNACHLEYSRAAREGLQEYQAQPREVRTTVPSAHPSLTVNPRNDHCFGCHSRSGRVVLSYEGWYETGLKVERDAPATKDTAAVVVTKIGPDARRILPDRRILARAAPDVHHERGLDCIDCHIASELMGVGTTVPSKAQQLRIGCEDCHARTVASIESEYIDPESRKLLALRNWTIGAGQRMGTTRDGAPLVNVRVDESGNARLLRKRTGQSLPLKPPVPACVDDPAHARLSCSSCHSAWAPRCIACHTSFDPGDEGFDHAAQQWVKGTWNETSATFEAAPPTLGVTGEGKARGSIDTFVPGMVMTFDRNMQPGGKPDIVFRRLFGRLDAHTTRKEVRGCTSCHNDPVALGFGTGELRFVSSGGTGKWQFVPAVKPSPYDGLPGDAWTGFLQDRTGMVSAHPGARPFNVDEQRRVLRVGACLTCHAGDSKPMQDALRDFGATLARRSRQCVIPAGS